MTEQDSGQQPLDQTLDVFAHFGLAIYLAQILEKSVLTAITLAQSLATGDRSAEGFEAAWNAQWNDRRGWTLGRLLKEFGSAVSPDPALVVDLRAALKVRNALAHHFFWDRSEDALSEVGRRAVRAELLPVQEQLNELSNRVFQTAIEMVVAHGGTQDLLLARVKRLFEDAEAEGRARDASE